MNKFKEYVYISFSMLIVSVAVYFFMGPSHLVIGSVSALAYVIVNFIPLPVSVITLVFNLLLILLGLLLIGKEFGAKTIYSTVIFSVYLAILEKLFPNIESLTQSNIYDALLYCVIVALGQAMLFHVNASSGGLDIVAKIMNKYTPLDLGSSVTIAGMLVATSSFFVYDIGTMIISMFWTYAQGIIIDNFIDGFNRKKRVCIISDEYEKIREFALYKLKRGVSMVKMIGGYDQKERMEVQIVMTKYEYKMLLNFLEKEQIPAFVTVSTINEVIGKWNQKKGL